MSEKEITEAMIEAGKAAYWGHFDGVDAYSTAQSPLTQRLDDAFTKQIKAIYKAMREAE